MLAETRINTELPLYVIYTCMYLSTKRLCTYVYITYMCVMIHLYYMDVLHVLMHFHISAVVPLQFTRVSKHTYIRTYIHTYFLVAYRIPTYTSPCYIKYTHTIHTHKHTYAHTYTTMLLMLYYEHTSSVPKHVRLSCRGANDSASIMTRLCHFPKCCRRVYLAVRQCHRGVPLIHNISCDST